MSTTVTFWNGAVNAEDAWFIPFCVPLIFWSGSYLFCRYHGHAFHKWYFLHNVHNFGAILLGSISILFAATRHSFNERIPILWSLSYFAVDILDCSLRLDIAYLFHALCCFFLGLMNYSVPTLRHLRMNSKAAYCELSNPFMHLAKRTRKPVHFLLFAIVFTACRMLWLPIMYYQLISYTPSDDDTLATTHMPWYHPSCCILLLFYGLNVYWYMKILQIIVSGDRSEKKDASREKAD
jgi:TLC domain